MGREVTAIINLEVNWECPHCEESQDAIDAAHEGFEHEEAYMIIDTAVKTINGAGKGFKHGLTCKECGRTFDCTMEW